MHNRKRKILAQPHLSSAEPRKRATLVAVKLILYQYFSPAACSLETIDTILPNGWQSTASTPASMSRTYCLTPRIERLQTIDTDLPSDGQRLGGPLLLSPSGKN
jgi:hypothetical protein